MDQYIGKVLGNRYEILEKIGSGGMAVVYKAKCHLLNRFVAIKILKDDLAQDEEFRHRFHEESRAVAMLSHPNIVSIYDVSRSEDSSEPDYFVMELIDGISLKQYMQKRGGALSWKEALHFITQIMKGLSHAHGRGIIHRDIKPHNIMVLRDGSVKVADFGIARLISSAQNTMTQEALGSVHYISPEQARGSHIDARSDIYSAGVVLYEMLTGRLPYEGDSPVAVAIQHINSIPLSPRELDPSIPEAMEEITMKAMASDLDKRYVSADAMLEDLEEFRKNPNISFDYTHEDLLVTDGEEPTQKIGANTPQVAANRQNHTERQEESMKKRKRPVQEEDDYESGGGVLRFFLILFMALLCLAGVVAFLWNTVFRDLFADPVTYRVPDLKGYTIEEARALPEVYENGFTITEGAFQPDEEVEVGRIIDQDRMPNTEVQSGEREITVTISAGRGGQQVPEVVNLDQRVARTLIQNAGLVPEIQEAYSEDVTKGNVISVSPEEKTIVDSGTVVVIQVSLGPKPKTVAMMPLLSMTREDAEQAIIDLGLQRGSVRSIPSDEYAEGLVCDVVILNENGVEVNMMEDEIKEGYTVHLWISSGPDTGTDPTVSPRPTGGSQTPNTESSQTPAPENSSTPGVIPTTPPAASQTPTPITKKDKSVTLPNDDRETVTVVVTVGGVEQYRQDHPTRLRSAFFTIEGSGVQEVVIYIDGVEFERYFEDFSV